MDDQAPDPDQARTRLDDLEQRAKEARAQAESLLRLAEQCEEEVRSAREAIPRPNPEGDPALTSTGGE